MASLRQAFLATATEERMRELGETLFTAAFGGDWQAAKLYLLFVVARPKGRDAPRGAESQGAQAAVSEWLGAHLKSWGIRFASASSHPFRPLGGRFFRIVPPRPNFFAFRHIQLYKGIDADRAGPVREKYRNFVIAFLTQADNVSIVKVAECRPQP